MTSSETAIEQFQREQWEWASTNFSSAKGWNAAYEATLGVGEELGEFSEAHEWDYPRRRDAAADTTVYLADVCNRLGFELEALWPQGNCLPRMTDPSKGFLVYLGRLQQAVLKMIQNIRQEQNHEANAKEAIRGILGLLIAHTPGHNDISFFPGVVSPVWEKVRERNWRPERETGDTSQRNAE